MLRRRWYAPEADFPGKWRARRLARDWWLVHCAHLVCPLDWRCSVCGLVHCAHVLCAHCTDREYDDYAGFRFDVSATPCRSWHSVRQQASAHHETKLPSNAVP